MGKSFDWNKNRSTQDVKDSAAAAGKEITEAASAVVDLVQGETTLAEAGKEVAEAGAAALETLETAADAVADAVVEKAGEVKRYFQTVLGYRLHDDTQNVAIEPTGATPAAVTPWVEKQIEAGLVREVDETGAAVAPLVPLKAPVVLTEADALADLNGTPRPDNPSQPQ